MNTDEPGAWDKSRISREVVLAHLAKRLGRAYETKDEIESVRDCKEFLIFIRDASPMLEDPDTVWDEAWVKQMKAIIDKQFDG